MSLTKRKAARLRRRASNRGPVCYLSAGAYARFVASYTAKLAGSGDWHDVLRLWDAPHCGRCGTTDLESVCPEEDSNLHAR